MQKVYVTVAHDAMGKEAVDEVFATYEAAVEYTITTLFADDEFYSGRTKGFLEAAAKNSIIERRIIGA